MGVLVEKALEFATRLHAGQVRKGTGLAYVTHPVAVAEIVKAHGGTEVEIAGALLHDTAEDCGGLPVIAEIKAKFGPEVAAIVLGCSDSLGAKNEKKAPWKERKEAYLEHLKVAPKSVALVSAADKLHNAKAIVSDYGAVGPAVFERFKAKKAGTVWYYRAMAEVFKGTEAPPALVAELGKAVAEMEAL